MKANFFNNMGRIRHDIRKYASKVWGLSWPWKIAILLILFFLSPLLLPVLEIGVMAVVPLVGTLFFVTDDFDGRKRGILAFALGTVSQLLTIAMIFSLLAMDGISGTLGLATIVSATLSGMMMLVPGYGVAYLFYGLNRKESDGRIFLFMIALLGVILGIWNTVAVVIS